MNKIVRKNDDGLQFLWSFPQAVLLSLCNCVGLSNSSEEETMVLLFLKNPMH